MKARDAGSGADSPIMAGFSSSFVVTASPAIELRDEPDDDRGRDGNETVKGLTGRFDGLELREWLRSLWIAGPQSPGLAISLRFPGVFCVIFVTRFGNHRRKGLFAHEISRLIKFCGC
jgi:hypothetical protein